MSSMEAEVPAKRIPAVALLRGEWIGTLKITSTATVILGKAPHESDPKGRRGSGPLATMHVAPGTCKSIAASHLRLRYVPSLSRWVAELLGKTTSMRINDQKYDAGCRPIVLASQDRIELPCETHGAHAMYWLLPVDTPKYPYISSLEPFSLLLSAGYTPFSRTEREQYMKGLLAFGHRRPEEIKRSQRGLDQRSVEEVYEFGISLFIRFLDLLLPQEAEERDYVTKVLKLENRFILCELVSLKRPTEPSLSGWKKVEKSAGSWVRRLTNLHYLHELFTLHETMGYDLLTGVPPGDLRKRKPADHWSLADDRMLLQGIYKHGYGNFDPIREDKEFVFGPKVEWPGLEKLNKRVKKILDGGKRSFLNLSKSFLNGAKASVFDDGFIPDISEDFDTWECKDSTCAAIENVPVWQSKVESLQRWKVTEIARFLEVLLDFGLRKTYDSDIDWDWIRQYGQLWDKLDRTLLDMLDNFLRCSEGLHSDEVSVISRTEAVVLVERLVLFEDIRGLVLNHYPDLAMAIQKTGPMLWVDPPAGRADAHAMLKVFHLGLTNALSTDDFPFKSEEEYLPRLSEAVTHMKNWFRAQNDWVELPGFTTMPISRKRSRSPIYFRSKEDGSILLPLVVTPTLKLAKLGDLTRARTIEADLKVSVGFRSIRVYTSCFPRCPSMEYDCEVFAGPDLSSLIYRVSPIIRTEEEKEEAGLLGFDDTSFCSSDSATEAWRLMNSLIAKTRRSTLIDDPTLDGLELFGLKDELVQTLISRDPKRAQSVKEVFVPVFTS